MKEAAAQADLRHSGTAKSPEGVKVAAKGHWRCARLPLLPLAAPPAALFHIGIDAAARSLTILLFRLRGISDILDQQSLFAERRAGSEAAAAALAQSRVDQDRPIDTVRSGKDMFPSHERSPAQVEEIEVTGVPSIDHSLGGDFFPAVEDEIIVAGGHDSSLETIAFWPEHLLDRLVEFRRADGRARRLEFAAIARKGDIITGPVMRHQRLDELQFLFGQFVMEEGPCLFAAEACFLPHQQQRNFRTEFGHGVGREAASQATPRDQYALPLCCYHKVDILSRECDRSHGSAAFPFESVILALFSYPERRAAGTVSPPQASIVRS